MNRASIGENFAPGVFIAAVGQNAAQIRKTLSAMAQNPAGAMLMRKLKTINAKKGRKLYINWATPHKMFSPLNLTKNKDYISPTCHSPEDAIISDSPFGDQYEGVRDYATISFSPLHGRIREHDYHGKRLEVASPPELSLFHEMLHGLHFLIGLAHKDHKYEEAQTIGYDYLDFDHRNSKLIFIPDSEEKLLTENGFRYFAGLEYRPNFDPETVEVVPKSTEELGIYRKGFTHERQHCNKWRQHYRV